MIEASEKTIVPKTPIKSCGDESAKCSGSSLVRPAFAQHPFRRPQQLQPSTTSRLSTLRIFRAEAAARWQDAVAIA